MKICIDFVFMKFYFRFSIFFIVEWFNLKSFFYSITGFISDFIIFLQQFIIFNQMKHF